MAYRPNSSNGLSTALGLMFAVALILGIVGGIGWWIYTAFDVVMSGWDHLIANVFGGPHLHWMLLLVLALVLAALAGWPFVLFGIWSAIWACNWAWWAALLMFIPGLFLLFSLVIAPAIFFGLLQGFIFLLQTIGGRR